MFLSQFFWGVNPELIGVNPDLKAQSPTGFVCFTVFHRGHSQLEAENDMTLKEGHRGSFGGLRSEGFLRFGVSLCMKDFFPTPTFGYGMYLDIYGQVYEKSQPV